MEKISKAEDAIPKIDEIVVPIARRIAQELSAALADEIESRLKLGRLDSGTIGWEEMLGEQLRSELIDFLEINGFCSYDFHFTEAEFSEAEPNRCAVCGDPREKHLVLIACPREGEEEEITRVEEAGALERKPE